MKQSVLLQSHPSWSRRTTYFACHIIVGCPVEVVVGPAEELVFSEFLLSLGVAEAEFSVRLEELALHRV